MKIAEFEILRASSANALRMTLLISSPLGVQISEAGFGGGKGFFLFAEGEADLRGAVAGVVVEAGAGDAGNADGFDEVFGEGNIAGIGGIFFFVELEAGDVRHDVVGASRFVDGEAGSGEDFEKALTLRGVVGCELVVIRLRGFEGKRTSLLEGRGGADSQEIVHFANGLGSVRRSNGPADAPAGDAVGLGYAADDDSAVSHAFCAGHGDVLGAVVRDVLVNFVGDAVGVPADAEIANKFEFGAGEDFASGIVGRVKNDGLCARAKCGGQLLFVEGPFGRLKFNEAGCGAGKNRVGAVIFVEGLK